MLKAYQVQFSEAKHVYDEVASDDYDTVPDIPPTFGEIGHPTENKESGAEKEGECSEHSPLCEKHYQDKVDLANGKLNDGAGKKEWQGFFSNSSSYMEEGVCKAMLSDEDSLEASSFDAIPPPLPLTLAQRWRRMMNSYEIEFGEAEHVLDEVAK